MDRFAGAKLCDLNIDDFGAAYDLEAQAIMCWALVTERLSGHTARVSARWEPEYGKIERVALEGALLPLGHALRRRVEGDGLVEAAGARAWASWCEDEEAAH